MTSCTIPTAEQRNALHTTCGAARPVPELVVAVPFLVAVCLAGFLFTYLTTCLVQAGIQSADDTTANWTVTATAWILATITGIGGLRWTTLLVLSYGSFHRQRHAATVSLRQWPLVSVFVPAYNESENIEAALQSLLLLDYPRYEVIVVDDGSTDDTFARARQFAGRYDRCTIHVHRKPNGGKWSAHNFAFRHSVGELVLCLDADSRVDPGSLTRMVVHLADPQIAAVAGQIRVRNRQTLLTRLQAMEYLMGNGCARMAMSFHGTVLIVAGPLGLFRRCVLEEVFLQYGRVDRELSDGEVAGPFEGNTFAEDFDLSMAVLSLGGRIRYEPLAVSHTRAPDTMPALFSQRYRWCRGTIQVLRKYFSRAKSRPDICRPRLVLWLGATYLLDLVMLPVIYLCGLGTLLLVTTSQVGGLELLAWAAAMLLVNLNAAAMFVLVQRDHFALLHVLPFYDIYQSFLLTLGWFMALIDEARGVSMRW